MLTPAQLERFDLPFVEGALTYFKRTGNPSSGFTALEDQMRQALTEARDRLLAAQQIMA